MKTCIFQYWIGEEPQWVKISKRKFKEYADAVGADYIFSNQLKYCNNSYFENLRVLHDPLFSKYDRVLYVDVDVIPENFNNIFDEKIRDVGLIPEYRPKGMNADPFFGLTKVEIQYKLAASYFKVPVYTPKTVKASYLMFNSGVILWSKEGIQKAAKHFMNWERWHYILEGNMSLDQPYINGQVQKHLDYTELELKWNCYPKFRFYEGKEPKEMNFVHYTGGKKKYIEEYYD